MKILRTLLVIYAISGIWFPASAGTVTRTVPLTGNVTRIYLNGSNQLHLTQGDEEYVRLTAPEEILPRINARVKGKALSLGNEKIWKPGLWGSMSKQDDTSVRFDVQLRQIDAIRIRGSGNAVTGEIVGDRLKIIMYGSGKIDMQSIKVRDLRLEISGSCDFHGETITAQDSKVKVVGSGNIQVKHMKTNELEINIGGSADITLGNLIAEKIETEINGSGDLDLEGRIDSQYLVINGSGDYKAQKLVSENADIEIRGGGDVEISVLKELTAEISRGADLVYHGGPELNIDISGKGKFRKAGEITRD